MMKKILSVFLSVLLICTTGINLLLSSAATGDAPVCKVFDFEDGNEPAFIKYFAESISSTSIETENPISGSNSYKVTFTAKGSTNNDGFLGIVLTEGLSSEKTYRVSGKYRVLSGTLGYFRVVNVGARSEASHFYNDAVATNRRFDVSVGKAVNAFTTPISFSGVITPTSSNGNISIGVRPSTSSTTTGMELLIDDITIAEIIDAPTAMADSAKGDVSVTNKDGHSNYAVGDTVTFTATAKEGYRFVCWEDEGGNLVSEDATYNHVLSESIVLTAKFELKQGSGGQDQVITVSFAGTPTPMDAITGAVGESMTLPAAPAKDGYYFAGWYTDAEFTKPAEVKFFPTEDQTFYAKYVEGNLWVQNFENYPYSLTGSATQPFTIYKATGTDDTTVYEGQYALKKDIIASGEKYVSVSNDQMNLTVGKGYKLTFQLKVTEVARTAFMNFRHISQRDNAWSYGSYVEQRIAAFPTNYEKKDQWVEHTFYFVAESPYFALSAASGVAFYLDDIEVEEVPIVTVRFNLGSGLTMDPITGVAGQAFSANPTTAPTGKRFAGWYTDANYKQTFSSQTFPTTDLTLYARWIDETSFEQDFEFWPFTPGTDSMSDTFALYTATGANDPNVYSGSHSLYYDAMDRTERKTTGFTVFDDIMGKLQVGEKYKMTVRYKPVESVTTSSDKTPSSNMNLYYTKSYTNFWHSYVQGPMIRYSPFVFKENTFTEEHWTGTSGVTATTLTKDANGWLTVTYEFTATTDYVAFFFTGYFSMYIDAISIDVLPSGVVAEDYAEPYCEPFYNELQVLDVMDLLDGSSKQVFKIAVEPREDYVFTASLKQKGNAKTKVYLAWDKEGNQPIDKTVFSANGSAWKLSSSRLITNFSQAVYLIVENGSADTVQYLSFFPTKYATAEDWSKVAPPDAADYTSLTTRRANSGLFKTGDAADTALESPTTGEGNALLICLLILSACTLLMVAVLRKGARD